MPTITTRKIRTVKPGSTQSRIDRSFGLSTTPPPGDAEDDDIAFESSGTVETGGAGRAQTGKKIDSQQAQIRALLTGAVKLAESEHFEEARMQLASVLELDSENIEAQEILKAVDEADVEQQKKRHDAAESVRLLVRAESFDQAATQLNKAVKEMGQADIFDDLHGEIETAKESYEKRVQEVNDIVEKAAKLMKGDGHEKAVPLLRQGLDLEPGNRVLIAQLEKAEKGLNALLDARRRVKEIEDAAATVAGHISNRDVDQAEHALALANRLYPSETAFADLATRLDELREELKQEKVQGLREKAQQEIEKTDFTAAIAILEEARRLAPQAAETSELLAAASEGLRLQEEARGRQVAIDDKALRIDRLILAGRLDSAALLIDAAVNELGDFDEASALRTQVEEAKAASEKAVKNVVALLDQALEHARGDTFSKANDVLDEAKALRSDNLEIFDLVSEAEAEVNRRIEAHRRQMTIDNVIQSVELQLEKESVEEARRELGVARRLYGASNLLDGLDAKIDTRERELQGDEIDKLIKNAQKKKKTTDEAVVDLEAAVAIDPYCEKAQRLLAEKRAAQIRALDDRLEAECEAILATIDDLIADGKPAKAIEALETAVKEVGDFRAARALRRRLEMQL